MRRTGRLALILAATLAAGCLVEVRRVSDPRPAFRQAREEALGVQGKPGPARSLNVLVYDPDEGQLVRVSLPMWLVRKIRHEGGLEGEVDPGADDEEDRLRRKLKRHIRLEEIEKAGLGILVEVEEEDGEQVLVWLR